MLIDDANKYREGFIAVFRKIFDYKVKLARKNGVEKPSKTRILKKAGFSLSTWYAIEAGSIKTPPTRQQIITLSEALNCTTLEQQRLLVAAGYQVLEPFLQGEELEKVLESRIWIMNTQIFYPAAIINRDWSILKLNKFVQKLFSVNETELEQLPKSLLRLLFDDDYFPKPFMQKAGKGNWERIAKQWVDLFKLDNNLYVKEPWYEETLNQVRGLPQFNEMYYSEPTEYDTTLEYVMKFSFAENVIGSVRVLFTRMGQSLYPQMLFVVPNDEETTKFFYSQK